MPAGSRSLDEGRGTRTRAWWRSVARHRCDDVGPQAVERRVDTLLGLDAEGSRGARREPDAGRTLDTAHSLRARLPPARREHGDECLDGWLWPGRSASSSSWRGPEVVALLGAAPTLVGDVDPIGFLARAAGTEGLLHQVGRGSGSAAPSTRIRARRGRRSRPGRAGAAAAGARRRWPRSWLLTTWAALAWSGRRWPSLTSSWSRCAATIDRCSTPARSNGGPGHVLGEDRGPLANAWARSRAGSMDGFAATGEAARAGAHR